MGFGRYVKKITKAVKRTSKKVGQAVKGGAKTVGGFGKQAVPALLGGGLGMLASGFGGSRDKSIQSGPGSARSQAARKMIRKPIKAQAGSGQIEYTAEFEQ